MTCTRNATLILATTLLGCAPGASPGPAATAPGPAAVTLAYAAQPAPLTYVATDSGHVRIDIPGMGPMDVVFDLNATSRLALAKAADGGLDATLTITALNGQMSNPQTGTSGVDNSAIPRDPARLTLTSAGRLTRVSLPELGRSLREVTTASTLFHDVFIRLPETAVRPGATWVDTVDITDQLGALSMTQRQEIRSTYAGDTVVAGRRLARITATTAITISASGDAGGMQIEQRLVGQGTHTALWDAARGRLVERRFESNATGSMTVVGAQLGDIPVTQQARSTVRLQEGG